MLPEPVKEAIAPEEEITPEDNGKHEMAVIDTTGDTKIIWDPDNDDEVANAKRTFADLKGKGFTPYSVKRNGRKDKILDEFDPDEAKIIMVPRMVGG